MRERDFIARVRELGGLATAREGREWSLVALRALADLIPNAELRRHFVSQLPGGLKSALRAEAPRGLLMDSDALVQHVAAALDTHASGGGRALKIVWRVLTEALSTGQVAEFEGHIPKDVAVFLGRGEQGS